MYDIKTHNADYVRANLPMYEQQLNVYAHIWQKLRHQPLDEMAVIATDFPESVQNALTNENEQELVYALSQWEPVVPIGFDPIEFDQTVKEFGEVVDEIEDGRFSPPPLEILNVLMPGSRSGRFATQVCRNCDARFSCSSYRQYSWQAGRKIAERPLMQYFVDSQSDGEQEAWRAANLDAASDAGSLRADFTTRQNC